MEPAEITKENSLTSVLKELRMPNPNLTYLSHIDVGVRSNFRPTHECGSWFPDDFQCLSARDRSYLAYFSFKWSKTKKILEN